MINIIIIIKYSAGKIEKISSSLFFFFDLVKFFADYIIIILTIFVSSEKLSEFSGTPQLWPLVSLEITCLTIDPISMRKYKDMIVDSTVFVLFCLGSWSLPTYEYINT